MVSYCIRKWSASSEKGIMPCAIACDNFILRRLTVLFSAFWLKRYFVGKTCWGHKIK